MTPEEYALLLRGELAKAIMLTGREPGHATVVFSGEAVSELLNVIALVVHNSDEVSSPSRNRSFCDALARRLQRRISEVQRLAAEGRLPFIVPERDGPPH